MEIDIRKVTAEFRSGSEDGPETNRLVELITAKVVARVRSELREAERFRDDEQPRTRVSEDGRIRR